MRKCLLFFMLIALFSLFSVAAQEAGREDLPEGFRNILLGMSFSEAEEELKNDSWFLYRGAPDVSLLREENNSLIRCEGTVYINEAYLQFENEILVILTLKMNERRIDHYSLFKRLTEQYGDPDDLDPSRCLWRSDKVTLILEKPSTVKYINEDFRRRENENLQTDKTEEEMNRTEFLELF